MTHVVRGDDHISNTPKQILLYQALGAALPKFAHVPLILGADKKRLSKRHGATSVMEYARQGYLPEAMVNFLALLGWSPGDNREVLSREELIAAFSLDAISGGDAVFNPEKLDWFNQQHLMRLPAEEILGRLRPALEAIGLTRGAFQEGEKAHLERAIELVKPRARRLADLVTHLRPFIAESIELDPAAVAKYLSDAALLPHLSAWRARLEATTPFDAATIEWTLRQVAETRGIKAAVLIHATRVAVTGQAVSPGVFEVLEVLGRERTIARLEAAERRLSN
jgi:glutamyl-tRNA synthetase